MQTTTGHEATTHNARETGIGGCMARRSFYSVVFVSSDSGAVTESRCFTTKRAAAKFAEVRPAEETVALTAIAPERALTE